MQSVFFYLFLNRVPVFFFLPGCPFLGILIFRVGLKQDERFFFLVGDTLEYFGAGEFGLVDYASVILLSVVVANGVLVIVENAAPEGGGSVALMSEGVELVVKTFLEQLENVFLLVFNAHFPDRLLYCHSQGRLLHLVQFQL